MDGEEVEVPADHDERYLIVRPRGAFRRNSIVVLLGAGWFQSAFACLETGIVPLISLTNF